MTLLHKSCGGEVRDDNTLQYEYDGHFVPAQRCARCGREIIGETEVESHANDAAHSLQYKISYNKRRREWLAVVYRQIDSVTHVLTIGCEDTQPEAAKWAKGTIELMLQYGRDDIELPDKYERREMH